MRTLLILIAFTLVLAACQPSAPADPTKYAQKMMEDAGKDSAKITNVVHGNPKYRKSDELWCIETDANTDDGMFPYLLAVWRNGDQWAGEEITQGYYEWDLYGCPRPQ